MAGQAVEHRATEVNNKGIEPQLIINRQDPSIIPEAGFKKDESNLNKDLKRHGVILITLV